MGERTFHGRFAGPSSFSEGSSAKESEELILVLGLCFEKRLLVPVAERGQCLKMDDPLDKKPTLSKQEEKEAIIGCYFLPSFSTCGFQGPEFCSYRAWRFCQISYYIHDEGWLIGDAPSLGTSSISSIAENYFEIQNHSG